MNGADLIASGQALDAGRQRVYQGFADYLFGLNGLKLQDQDRKLSLQQDILSKQQAIAGIRAMGDAAQKPPNNPDGSIDYKSLARMILPYNPELALKYDQEASNSEGKKAKAAKDAADAQSKITKQAGDIISGVSDQTSLDAARSQLQTIPGFSLSPNFPKQYNPDTAKWLRSYGNAFLGASGKLDQAAQEAKILSEKASAARSFAEAKETTYKADMAKIDDQRAKQGLGPLKSSASAFTDREGELMAALSEQGVSLPVGFRSKDQQKALYRGILERNPDKTPDEIARLIKTGQIEFQAQKKETQTAAGIAGRVEVAQNEIEQFAPLVRQASANVPRTDFIPINKLLQMGEDNISSPDLRELKIYINSLLNAYDVLSGRGGTDKEKREHARSLLTSADSPETLERGLKAFENEAKAAHAAAVKATRVPELTPKEDQTTTSTDGWGPVQKVQQ